MSNNFKKVFFVPKKAYEKIEKDACNIDFELNKFKLYFILDLITKKYVRITDIIENNDGFSPIFSSEFTDVIGKKTGSPKNNYKDYLLLLTENNIIEINENYLSSQLAKKSGKKPKPKGYKITSEYITQLITVKVTDAKFFKKLSKNKKNIEDDLPLYLKKMKEELCNIKFDEEKALAWIDTNIKDKRKKNRILYSFFEILNGNFYFSRNKTNNRLDTNLTNLKSELKQFIIGDYYDIDLTNSQPVLFNFLMFQLFPLKNIEGEILFYNKVYDFNNFFKMELINNILNDDCYKSKEFEKERIKFHKWTINGVFYDEFAEEYNKYSKQKITRKKAKNIVFKIFFSDIVWINKKTQELTLSYSKERVIFKSIFPLIHQLITELKVEGHENFSIYLQRIESELFIDKISKTLVEQNIIPLTVHDSFLIKKKDKQKASIIVRDILKDFFLVNPKFSTKEINN